ncbi:CBO0543 family protein [Oceanobacillus kapialis]|uniref:CBO0543 family protein n=1 Tax=Oceanobacillus kapialis TaxID=481353 RepID=UPI003851233F
MDGSQQQLLKEIEDKQTENTHGFIDYWFKHSSFDTWQFWVHVILLIAPLVILYFKIDRKRALLLGFYGFNVHVWFTYIDVFGAKLGFWSYPYQIMPVITVSFGLDISFIPVVYMLLYQWVLNHDKNYYLYLTGLCLFIGFIFKPLMVAVGLFELDKGANYFHIFIGYIVIMLISKWITDLFIYFEKKPKV